jgi:hypothetical protein
MLRAIGYGLLAGLIFACLSQLSGCGQRQVEPATPNKLVFAHSDPDEYGVVCYMAYTSSAPLSCVQVQEGHTR